MFATLLEIDFACENRVGTFVESLEPNVETANEECRNPSNFEVFAFLVENDRFVAVVVVAVVFVDVAE